MIFSLTMIFASQSLATKGKADACDDIIPVLFLGSRIVDEHAVNEALREIATVVPDLIALVARYGKEPGGNSLVLNIARRVFFREESGGRVLFGVEHGLNR